MNRTTFLAHPKVIGAAKFISSCFDSLRVRYESDYRQLDNRVFKVTGLKYGVDVYSWPSTISTPHGPQRISNWIDTQNFLTWEGIALRSAIANNNDQDAWCHAERILDWGVGAKAKRSNLDTLSAVSSTQGLACYLAGLRDLMILNKADLTTFNAQTIPRMTAGLSKVHALAANDGLIIYDSRVAAALTECINEYLRREGDNTVPEVLRLCVEWRHRTTNPRQRRPLPLLTGANHFAMPRQVHRAYRWAQSTVKASWLLDEVLRISPKLFAEHTHVDRMHYMEASLFMAGAYLVQGLLVNPELVDEVRTFDFSAVV